MGSRAQKRPGFASLQGAENSRISQGSEKPKNPKQFDIHFDRVRGILSEYDGSDWIEYSLLYVSDTEPTNKNVIWLDIS
jgi:hypothetical protein